MIEEKVRELEKKKKEYEELRKQIDDEIISLAEEYCKIFGFATDGRKNPIVEFVVGGFDVKYECYVGGAWDYWEQEIPAFNAFGGYGFFPTNRVHITYSQVDNKEKTKEAWQKRMSDWRKWRVAKRIKQKKEDEEREKEYYRELKAKFEGEEVPK